MNVLYLSPHYPPNFEEFTVALNKNGAAVFAICDTPWETLSPMLRHCLRGFRRVGSLADTASVLSAARSLANEAGTFDVVESHIESWLETEAVIRDNLKIPGLCLSDIRNLRSKDKTKDLFRSGGIPVAPGKIVHGLREARQFAKDHGYPMILKPEYGVGADRTFRIDSDSALADVAHLCFGDSSRPLTFAEAFVDGTIESFDGLTDQGGNIVFHTVHTQSAGVREIAHEQRDFFIYSLLNPPSDLLSHGFKAVELLGLRSKFFHIEFFRDLAGNLCLLEANLRPPGGRILDMMNLASDISLQNAWASICVHNRFPYEANPRWHTLHVSRRRRFSYRFTREQIESRFSDCICDWVRLDKAAANAMGEEAILGRHANLLQLFSLQLMAQQIS